MGLIQKNQNTTRSQMSFREKLAKLWNNVQYKLFPDLEERVGEISSTHKQLVAVLELVRIEEFLPCTRFNFGRPLKDRIPIARSFIAKIIFKITHTKDLIRNLKADKQLRVICGWDSSDIIPSESKFSRAFHEFAETSLSDKVHQALIADVYKDKIIGHLVKDSTPIHAREQYLKKKGSTSERRRLLNIQQAKEKRAGISRKQKQLKQDLNTMINDLPIRCDMGTKKGSNGYNTTWKGYKLHAAVDDHCIPIAAVLTSASLNDSEVAIPLGTKSDLVSKNFYDLMDSAYDAPEIREHSYSLGHVPIIDARPRTVKQKEQKKAEQLRKHILKAHTAEDKRYKERLPKERFNALLKDHYGGRNVLYKGHSKVFCHLMFGVLALTATTLLSFL